MSNRSDWSDYYTKIGGSECIHQHVTHLKLKKKPEGTATNDWLLRAIKEILDQQIEEKHNVKEVGFVLIDENTDVCMSSSFVPYERKVCLLMLQYLALKFTVHYNTRPNKDVLTFAIVYHHY